MATSKLIQWVPEILQATDEDIARFGPQAARVRALLDFIPTISQDAASIPEVYGQVRQHKPIDAAIQAAWDNVRMDARTNAMNTADAAIKGAAGDADIADYAAWDAAAAEVVNDLIEPEFYRILTAPLNISRLADLRAPEAGSEFMRLARALKPTSVDDIERIADLSVDPRIAALVQVADAVKFPANMPAAERLKMLERLYRNSALGRRGI